MLTFAAQPASHWLATCTMMHAGPGTCARLRASSNCELVAPRARQMCSLVDCLVPDDSARRWRTAANVHCRRSLQQCRSSQVRQPASSSPPLSRLPPPPAAQARSPQSLPHSPLPPLAPLVQARRPGSPPALSQHSSRPGAGPAKARSPRSPPYYPC